MNAAALVPTLRVGMRAATLRVAARIRPSTQSLHGQRRRAAGHAFPRGAWERGFGRWVQRASLPIGRRKLHPPGLDVRSGRHLPLRRCRARRKRMRFPMRPGVVGPAEGDLRAVLVRRAIDQVDLAADIAAPAAVLNRTCHRRDAWARQSAPNPSRSSATRNRPARGHGPESSSPLTIGFHVLPPSLLSSIWYLISGRGGLPDAMCAAGVNLHGRFPCAAVASCNVTVGEPNLAVHDMGLRLLPVRPRRDDRSSARLELHGAGPCPSVAE